MIKTSLNKLILTVLLLRSLYIKGYLDIMSHPYLFAVKSTRLQLTHFVAPLKGIFRYLNLRVSKHTILRTHWIFFEFFYVLFAA